MDLTNRVAAEDQFLSRAAVPPKVVVAGNNMPAFKPYMCTGLNPVLDFFFKVPAIRQNSILDDNWNAVADHADGMIHAAFVPI